MGILGFLLPLATAGMGMASTAGAEGPRPPTGGVASLPPAAFQLQQNTRSAVLMDAASGRVLWAKNPDQRQPIASVTKIMTMVLALEALRDGTVSPNDPVVASEYAKSMGGTQIWLEVGESRPFQELLTAVAVGSANDAAVALAEHLAGSEEAFVQKMNERAKQLGLTDTLYGNPTGLPSESVGKLGVPQYSSALDVARLSRYALTLPGFRDLVSTYEYTVRPEGLRQPVLYNFNTLLRRLPGVDGIKTGFTNEAGYCISVSALRDGLRLIAVVLGAPTRAERDTAVAALLNWGYRTFTAQRLVSKDTPWGDLPVWRGNPEKVAVVVGQDLSVTVPRGTKIEFETEATVNQRLTAPVQAGQQVGKLTVHSGGEVVGEVPLVAKQPVRSASFWEMVGRGMRITLQGLYPPRTPRSRTTMVRF